MDTQSDLIVEAQKIQANLDDLKDRLGLSDEVITRGIINRRWIRALVPAVIWLLILSGVALRNYGKVNDTAKDVKAAQCNLYAYVLKTANPDRLKNEPSYAAGIEFVRTEAEQLGCDA